MPDRDMPGGDEADSGLDLHRRAELRLLQRAEEDEASLTFDEVKRVLHELRVHQIELEIQNEELRRAQVALDESRARYFDLYDLAPVGYLTFDGLGVILEANLRACNMLGLTRAEVVGQTLNRFIFNDDQDAYYLHRKRLFASGEFQTCELRIVRPDGAQVWIRMEAAGVQGQMGDTTACRTTLSDISEQREIQANLAQTDRMSSMGLLAAGVAHEINNPLTFVLYHIESLAEDLPLLIATIGRFREALRERVGSEALGQIAGDGSSLMDPIALADMANNAAQAVDGAQRIKSIAKSLSFFSRPELADLVMVDLNLAAIHAINIARNEIQSRAVLVEDLGEIPQVLASDGKLAQVLLNLLVNAAHSIDEGNVEKHRVSVRTWSEADQVFAEVADTGSGISAEDLELVFEPFFTTKGPDRGTGLGLAISRRIVLDFGGELGVESTVGEGSRFLVRLPIPRIRRELRPMETAPASELRGRILIVDDEKMVRFAFESILKAVHEVVSVESGKKALELLAEDSSFDVVLCDLMMRDVSGIELHARLLEDHPRLAEKLVFITGGVFTPKVSDYLGRHTNLVVEKPIDATSLRNLVSQLLLTAREE